MTKVVSGFLLGLFFVLMIALLAFVTLMAFTEKMRLKALKRLTKISSEAGITISKTYMKRQLDRLNLWDLRTLDIWTDLLEKKDYAGAFSMWPEVLVIFQKTDLGIIFGGFGTLLASLRSTGGGSPRI